MVHLSAESRASDVAVCKELSELLGKADFVVWLNEHLYGVRVLNHIMSWGSLHNRNQVVLLSKQGQGIGFNAGDVVCLSRQQHDKRKFFAK